MQIIGVVGLIGSGKDTVSNYITSQTDGKRTSFAAPLKDMCSAVFGWPRHLLEGDTDESRDFRETPDIYWAGKLSMPNFTPRLALQLMGTEIMRESFHQDIWLNSLEYRLLKDNETELVVVSDCRFMNELSLIKEMGGHVIRVVRGEEPEWYETASLANTGDPIAEKIMMNTYNDIHQSEWAWAGFDYDTVINNDGTLLELQEQVKSLVIGPMFGS